jgi:hypothetical protein
MEARSPKSVEKAQTMAGDHGLRPVGLHNNPVYRRGSARTETDQLEALLRDFGIRDRFI